MNNQLSKRVEKISAAINTEYAEVIRWINEGRYYDELSEGEKDLYCSYRNESREAIEEIRKMIYSDDIGGALHFQLEKNQPPMTEEEEREHLKKTAAEIEAFLLQSRYTDTVNGV